MHHPLPYPRVVSDLALLVRDVHDSPYHQHMDPAEARLKYPLSARTPTIPDVMRDGCRPLRPDELHRMLPHVHRAAQAIHELVQGCTDMLLLVETINIVALTNRAIEFNNSWTVGTTIVLARFDAVEHEVCHVYQRKFPTPFDRFYMRATDHRLIRLTWEDVQHVLAHVPAMDNPDCSVHVKWQYAWVDKDSGRRRRGAVVLPLLDRQDCSRMLVDLDLDSSVAAPPGAVGPAAPTILRVRRHTSQWVDFHGQRQLLEHPHEMFAAWVARQLRAPAPGGGGPS